MTQHGVCQVLSFCEALKLVYQLKLVLSLESPIIFDERFKVTSIPCFIPAFNLLKGKSKMFL